MFEAEKEKLVQIGIDNLKRDFQNKLDKLQIESKIEASAKTNEGRRNTMVARTACIEKVKEAARKRIVEVSDPTNKEYLATLKNLIVQVSNIKNTFFVVLKYLLIAINFCII